MDTKLDWQRKMVRFDGLSGGMQAVARELGATEMLLLGTHGEGDHKIKIYETPAGYKVADTNGGVVGEDDDGYEALINSITGRETRRWFVVVACGEAVTRNDRDELSTGGILGAPVSSENVYISCYPVCDRAPTSLAVGERTRAEYRLSGTRGTYEIVRVC